MKKIFLPFCLILFAQFQACQSKCDEDSGWDANFDYIYTEKIPYKDSSQLTFINTLTNDIYVFKGQGWISNHVIAIPQPEKCRGNNVEVKRELVFISPTYNKKIRIGLTQTTLGEDVTLFISLEPKGFVLKNLNYFYHDSTPYYIQGKLYQEVYKCDDLYNNTNTGSDSCYYQAKYGIIRLLTDSVKLELLEFK